MPDPPVPPSCPDFHVFCMPPPPPPVFVVPLLAPVVERPAPPIWYAVARWTLRTVSDPTFGVYRGVGFNVPVVALVAVALGQPYMVVSHYRLPGSFQGSTDPMSWSNFVGRRCHEVIVRRPSERDVVGRRCRRG